MKLSCLVVALLVMFIVQAGGQELPKPTQEHKFLDHFAGEWQTDPATSPAENEKCAINEGTMTSRNLGGFWVINEYKSTMPGVSMTGIQTVGYDLESKKYVGTWVDTMTGYLWKYEGTVNQEKTVITLNAEGPDMANPEKKTMYRDIYDFSQPGKMTFRAEIQDKNGQWTTFMKSTSSRKNNPARK